MLVFSPSHIQGVSEDAQVPMLWLVITRVDLLSCILVMQNAIHWTVSVSPDTHPGLKPCGRYQLLLQLEMQVCCQGPLPYLVLMFLVPLPLPRGVGGTSWNFFLFSSATFASPCSSILPPLSWSQSSLSLSLFRIHSLLSYLTFLTHWTKTVDASNLALLF
jgi:hypothetical protein